MGFGENLQFLRQKKGLTQEQVAEQLRVSRQSVSKWESGNSYPEMDKIMQLCDLFQCSMDALIKQDAKTVCVQDDIKYERHMNQYSRAVTFGVGFILLGVSIYEFMAGMRMPENLCNMIFLIIVVVSVMVFIVFGMRDSDFKRKYKEISIVYPEEEIDKFHKTHINMIATGVGIILIGVIFEGFVDGIRPPRPFTEDIYHGVFMLAVAAGVSLLTYAGMQKKKYDIEKSNKADSLTAERKGKESMCGKICGAIMLIATIIFLLLGFVWSSFWSFAWITFPIGGILCGIVTMFLSKD